MEFHVGGPVLQCYHGQVGGPDAGRERPENGFVVEAVAESNFKECSNRNLR